MTQPRKKDTFDIASVELMYLFKIKTHFCSNVEFTQTKYKILITKKGSSPNFYENRGKASFTRT